jgi:hypothetical protein
MQTDTCYWCGEEFEAADAPTLNAKFLEHGAEVHETELDNAVERRGEQIQPAIAAAIIRDGPRMDG